MSEISDRIKSAIKASGLSQRELEKITGIPQSAIQRYAAGDTDKVPVGRLEAIARATGTTAEHLLGWDTETERNAAQITEEDLELLKLFTALPVDKQKQALDYLRYLVMTLGNP